MEEYSEYGDYYKRGSDTYVFTRICRISKSTFFTKHLRATASDLSKLYKKLSKTLRNSLLKFIRHSTYIYLSIYSTRRSFSLVAPYSVKFTCCSLQNSLVTRCKISLVTRCKKSLVTHRKIRSLLVAEVAHCKNSLATRCKIRSLLAAEVARCKKLLVTRCKIHSLLVAEVARCKKSLVTRCETHLLLVAKNHSLLVAKNHLVFSI